MLLFLAARVLADDAPAPPDDLEVTALRDRVRALEARLDAVEQTGRAPNTIPVDFSTHVHGYAALDAEAHLTEPFSFALDDVVLTYDANVARLARFDAELAYRLTGEALADIQVEEVKVTLTASPHLRFVVGQFQNPITMWSELGLHGEYRYTPLGLPEMLNREDQDGPLPMHQVGASAAADAAPGLWQFGGKLVVSNGRDPILGAVPQDGDSSWAKSVMLAGWLEAPGGLRVQVAGSFDRIALDVVPEAPPGEALTSPVDETLGEIGVSYVTQRVEVRAEHFLMAHTPDGDSTTVGQGGYLLAGTRFRRVHPFVLTEWISLPSDVIFDQGEPRTQVRGAVGVRYDPWLHVCVKALINVAYTPADRGTDLAFEPGFHLALATGF